jgi:hypothetical protein
MNKTPMLTREEFENIYDKGKEATYAFILDLLRNHPWSLIIKQKCGRVFKVG